MVVDFGLDAVKLGEVSNSFKVIFIPILNCYHFKSLNDVLCNFSLCQYYLSPEIPKKLSFYGFPTDGVAQINKPFVLVSIGFKLYLKHIKQINLNSMTAPVTRP